VEEYPAFAAMASRGSALRRRLETLLDDAPRRHRRRGPWLAVTSVAVPAVCLAPVVTTADLAHVPAAAAQFVRYAQVAQPVESAVPDPGRADPQPAPRSSSAAAAVPPIAAATDRTADPEIPLDESSSAATPESLTGPDLEPEAALSRAESRDAEHPSTRLRDAIAVARITPEPAPPAQLYVPERGRGALSRIARQIRFDTTRPKLDVVDPGRLAQRRAQQTWFDAPR
jgi:hypothetical protein